MKVIVLGSAAGGGFPQWNCNCRNCKGVREGSIRARARTQSSIAVSQDGRQWALINASPDVLHQIAANPALQPGSSLRETPICGVMLVDSQLDHTLGLLLLREGKALRVYSTRAVRADLTSSNPLFTLLDSYCGVEWHEIFADRIEPFEMEGLPGLSVQAVPLAGKAPPYSLGENQDRSFGRNIGLLIEEPASAHRLFYAPGLRCVDEAVIRSMNAATCIMADGTFWVEDEMVRTGVGIKSAGAMGHLPQSGPNGMLATLARFPDARRILVHINNTNPILDENSEERRLVEKQGIEVAYDGMEIDLSRS